MHPLVPFLLLHDSIKSFKEIYTKFPPMFQQTVLSSQTIAEVIARIDAANTRSSKAKFTETEKV